MEINDLPLRELFYKLRSAGLVLGIDEYQLLLQALMAGFGLADRNALRQLCKTLWVKSLAEEHTFYEYFDRLISQEISTEIIKETVTLEPPVEPKSPNLDPIPEPKPEKPSDESSLPELPSNQSVGDEFLDPTLEDTDISEITLGIEDVIQAAKAQTSELFGAETADYLLLDDYLPVTVRQMNQSWRYLRRPVREGALTELDVSATIDQIAQQGFFLNPVLVPQRVNRSQLILLLDLNGSMVAFHSLGERIKDTVIAGGQLGRSQVYYFHNCPVDYLYLDPGQRYYRTFEQVLHQTSPSYTSVLIFSDAGAARGGYSEDRLEWTQIFLQQLQQKIRYVAWLNPVPRERWAGTTAGEIAKLVPMFESDRPGLQQAIKVLQGNLIRR